MVCKSWRRNAVRNTKASANASAFRFQITFLHLGDFSATNTKMHALFLKQLPFHDRIKKNNDTRLRAINYLTQLRLTNPLNVRYSNCLGLEMISVFTFPEPWRRGRKHLASWIKIISNPKS